jgi:hypothetical protein
MNSLRIQQQALCRVTDIAIANVHVDQYQKEKLNAMASTSTEAPIQVPNATETVGTDAPIQQTSNVTKVAGDKKDAGQQMYPLLADIYGDAFDPSNLESKKFIKPLMSEIMRLMDASRQGINVIDYAGHVISFLHMPQSSSNKLFNNSKSWVDNALQISGSPHNGTFESAFCVANHLCRFLWRLSS